MAETATRELRYGGTIPADYLPAHNHVSHVPGFIAGQNGFRRFWIPPEYVKSGKWAECPCGWQDRGKKWNESGVHYAHADHVQWWRDAIAQCGSLEAAYREIETRVRTAG